MIRICRMNYNDVGFAVRLARQEKWGTPPSDFRRILRLSPRGCFIASDDRARVGMITTVAFGKELAWIGNVIVDRNHRGKHIGHSLVKHVLQHLKTSRVKRAGLYCFTNNLGFYQKLGFNIDVKFTRLCREPQNEPLPRKYPISQKPNFAELLALDKIAFGADRSLLLRSIVSSRYGMYSGFYTKKKGAFLITKKYRTTYDFGPATAIGSSYEEIEQLLMEAVCKAWGKPIETSCLDLNHQMLGLLKREGFRPTNHGYRMFFERNADLGSNQSSLLLGFLDKG